MPTSFACRLLFRYNISHTYRKTTRHIRIVAVCLLHDSAVDNLSSRHTPSISYCTCVPHNDQECWHETCTPQYPPPSPKWCAYCGYVSNKTYFANTLSFNVFWNAYMCWLKCILQSDFFPGTPLHGYHNNLKLLIRTFKHMCVYCNRVINLFFKL